LSNEQLTELVGKAVKFAPTSFNMQQNRVVIVTGDKHRKLWDLIIDAQKANDPCELPRSMSLLAAGADR
jgi:predicted oxidoreductase (fatty acid repression mutant protein)